MDVYNFHVCSLKADWTQCKIALEDITIDNCLVKVQSGVVSAPVNKIKDAILYVELKENEWLSATYNSEFNPSIPGELESFKRDLNNLIIFYKNVVE